MPSHDEVTIETKKAEVHEVEEKDEGLSLGFLWPETKSYYEKLRTLNENSPLRGVRVGGAKLSKSHEDATQV